MLKEDGQYQKIIDIFEEVIRIVPSEENFHIYYMEALLKQGQIKHAISHYEFITSWLNNEFAVKPSSAMKSLYRKIKNSEQGKGPMDLNSINNELGDELENGPLLCDIDYFKFLYNLSRRRSARQEKLDYTGLVTLHKKNNLSPEKTKEIMGKLSAMINKSLRKGDIYSFWNDTQLVLIISEIDDKNLTIVEKRICKNLCKLFNDDAFRLETKFQPITSNERLIL